MSFPVSRRTFLGGAVALVSRTAFADARFETFSQWREGSLEARAAQLPACVKRIRATDASIQAWVQVLPQPATATGTLSNIPFGAKDIIETKGLATEYGSPIYKGRIGTADAAIVRQLRHRGAILLGKTQ